MINVLYCSDEKGFDGILINLISLCKRSSEILNVFVLTMDLRSIDRKHCPITEKHTTLLKEVINKYNNQSNIYLIDASELFLKYVAKDNKNMNTFYTPYCMLRLVSDLIKQLPDKIIYMDTDTVLLDDISKLYNINIDNYEIAAVEDYLGKWFKYRGYINSGVLLMNLKKIKQTGLLATTREKCKSRKSWFPDQDALNSSIDFKLMLPERFNSQRKLKKDTVILHFCKSIRWLPFYHTVNVKPWQIDDVHKVLKITAIDDVLEEYCQIKERFSA